MRKPNSESFGSLLPMSLRKSKSGLNVWSRESLSGVSGSLSNRMSTKRKNSDRACLNAAGHLQIGHRHLFPKALDTTILRY
jgi:hypothetical protein